MRPRALAVALAACGALGVLALHSRPDPARRAARRIEVEYQPQPTPVGCAAAAAAMVATRLGAPTLALALLREVPVAADGVSFYDLELALERRGLSALVYSGEEGELRGLLEAGLPVVVALAQGAKHAVVARGFDDAAVSLLDPGAPGRTSMPWPEFRERWAAAASQVFLVWSQAEPPPFSPAALEQHRAADRRFRAEELLGRARAHPVPNPRSLALLDEAVRLDPSVPGLAEELARERAALGAR